MIILIHENLNERHGYDASHVMHESQMPIMHHMHYMHCMHVLNPHMYYMHGGIYIRKEGREGRNQYQSIKLCTESRD